ncbi:Efflux pump periplasmic linker BepF [Polystyrenella longa]|uniref:Efflux pump periplasmic linker BepF n=1 Tax=Polystyrenella longa TaxID=2528007 RepID=A0A518CHK8_9PLAN|nr:efflux RND transporter periplasmic adaptor subunit [Polystyrenella longa]QDU78654.1 Efflux pump periplasmic linker BepF [Polystyrenella longa]
MTPPVPFSIVPSRTRSFVRVSCLLIVCSLIAGCERKPTPISETPPPEVTIAQPLEQTFADFAEFTGTTEAVEHVEIQARVTGYLDKINFDEGELVEEGEVLFEIDPRPYQATLDATKAKVLQWEASLKKSQADLARNKELADRGALTPEQLEASIADEGIQSANLEGAKADLRQAELDLTFTKVLSPVAGRVSKSNLTKGNLVSAVNISGIPLTTVVSMDPIHVYFDVDERTILKAQAEHRKQYGGEDKRKLSEVQWPVWIKLANENSFEHQGVLDFVDNQVDSGTGTIRLRAKFDNTNNFLLPGLFVTVKIPLGKERPHVLVPSRAIGTDQGNKFVLVIDENKMAQYRQVTPGLQTDDGMREIEAGLQADEWIVIDGLQRAQPGTTVNPVKQELSAEESESEESPEKSPASEPAPAQETPESKPAEPAK